MSDPAETPPESHDAAPDRWRTRVVQLLERRRRIESAGLDRAPDGSSLCIEVTIDTGSALVAPLPTDVEPWRAAKAVRQRLDRHFE